MTAPSQARAAFQALVDPHLEAMHRTARRLTRDEADADDLLQETLLKAFRSIDRFEQGSNFKAWVFTILTNTFINEYRRRRRGGAVELELDPALDPGVEETPPEEVPTENLDLDLDSMLDLVDERIRQAVLELPDNLRVVFVLAVVEDLKYRQIADMLDCPVGTVMSRLFRARAALKQRLQHLAVEEGYLRD